MSITELRKPARYISPADTAKLIRVALRKEFPTVKFSVRTSTYSGGASIDVKWENGPTSKMVERVTGKFSGASFDGMVDLKSYRDSELGGERVHFGADYVFTSRSLTREVLEQVIIAAQRKYGIVAVLDQYGRMETKPFDNSAEHWLFQLQGSAYCDAAGRVVAYVEVK